MNIYKPLLVYKLAMQLTYTFDGEPEVALIVDVPKTREGEVAPKTVWKTRLDLYTIMMNISQETGRVLVEITQERQDSPAGD